MLSTRSRFRGKNFECFFGNLLSNKTLFNKRIEIATKFKGILDIRKDNVSLVQYNILTKLTIIKFQPCYFDELPGSYRMNFVTVYLIFFQH